MNVYSILAHPNRQSLNGSLFDHANNYFSSLGYNVDTIHLQEHFQQLVESNLATSDENKIPAEYKTYRSSMSVNYNQGVAISTEFAKEQIAKLKAADILFIQTPIMVWSLPAILKFYIEMVFVPCQLFLMYLPEDDTNFHITKLMLGKKVFFSFTLGCSQGVTNSVTGSADNLVHPSKSTFEFVGYEWLSPHITWGTMTTSEKLSKKDEYFASFNDTLINTFAAPTSVDAGILDA